MFVVKIGLLFLCFLQLRLVRSSCPLSTSTFGNEFYSTPQSNDLLTTCFQYDNSTCCKKDYTDRILLGNDFISNQIMSKLTQPLPSSCQQAFSTLICLPCAPDQSVWIERIANNKFRLSLCPEYCNRLYSQCASATIAASNMLVSQIYQNGADFCYGFLRSDTFIPEVTESGDWECVDPTARKCTEADIGHFYTPCLGGKRDLIYYWKMGHDCRGGVSLPDNIVGRPCPITCGAGLRLPPGGSACESCRPGYYTLGNGRRINSWYEWPEDLSFQTWCEEMLFGTRIPPSRCAGWKLNGTYVESGIAGRWGISSVLRLEVQLVVSGYIAFLAQVDAEQGFDKFYFRMDDNPRLWIDNSVTPQLWKFNLTAGIHIFEWRFTKDYFIDRGADRAAIWMIELGGISFAEETCNPCVPGTFNDRVGSSDCLQCPANTYNNVSASTRCYACPDTHYSYPGSTTCTLRLPCTTRDYEAYYSECEEGNVRTKFYRWLEPMICNPNSGVQLPPPQYNQTCAPCNPGERRSGHNCVYCEEGSMSVGGPTATCQRCPAGTYAPKKRSFSSWNRWPENSTLFCATGPCGTMWRLREDHADSGTNHGANAAVGFALAPVVMKESGTFTINATLTCVAYCNFNIYVNQSLYAFWWADWTRGTVKMNSTFNLRAGTHDVAFIYRHYTSNNEAGNAKIYTISFTGVRDGGATECVACPVGTYSTEGVSVCTPCSVGTYADRLNSTQCSPCPANTYQNDVGQKECKPCGTNTYTPPGAAFCSDNNCTFIMNDTVYYLGNLTKTNGAYGPLVDGTNAYYLNVCSRNSTCTDRRGISLNSYACEVGVNETVSLGTVVSYYPLESPSEEGLVMRLTDGTRGRCSNLNGTKPREANITFICDPLAGSGTPTIVSVNDTLCSYNFEWRSVFACPLCTERHYSSQLTVCQNGQQWRYYYWNVNPKNCHDGVKLPDPVLLNCSTSIICPPGTHLTGNETCVPCDKQNFSLGTGEVYDNFGTSLDELGFTTDCSPQPCTPWHIRDGIIYSGTHFSRLNWIKNFVLSGTITFVFAVSYADTEHTFGFYIDDMLAFIVTEPTFGYITRNVTDLSLGTHRFSWRYLRKTESFTGERSGYVAIASIALSGILKAVPWCASCPLAHIAIDNHTACRECPPDTTAEDNRCVPCPPNHIRMAGTSNCIRKPQCPSNYIVEVLDDCNVQRNQTTKRFVPLEPTLCNVNSTTLPPPEIIPCPPCPRGLYYNGTKCVACAKGSYYDTKIKQCRVTPLGTAAIRTTQYFHEQQSITEWPPEFSTQCVGSCTRNGWRLRGNFMDSGVHAQEVDSQVTLQTEVFNLFVLFSAVYVAHSSCLADCATFLPKRDCLVSVLSSRRLPRFSSSRSFSQKCAVTVDATVRSSIFY